MANEKEVAKRPLSWRSTEFFVSVTGAFLGALVAGNVVPETTAIIITPFLLAGGRVWSKFFPKTEKT